ncbi:MAG: hypothetical protein V4735_06545 [Pseudomonadota bacterium]
MSKLSDSNAIFIARSEAYAPADAACERWPWAGKKLTPQLRHLLGMPDDCHPIRIIMSDEQDYRVAANGYLMPYYKESTISAYHSTADTVLRNEGLIVSRAQNFHANSQPDLRVTRTAEDIKTAFAKFYSMPENDQMECARKAGQFNVAIGAAIMRLETLGRIITQKNGYGVKIEYDDIRNAADIQPARIKDLKKEFWGIYKMLSDESLHPLLRCMRLNDKERDHDGILIDLIREIGKPLEANYLDVETHVRDAIVTKIGNAMESIDQVHDRLVQAITQEPTATLFNAAVQKFIRQQGEHFKISGVADIVKHLDRYADLCKARAGIRGEDPAGYDDVFSQHSALDELFNSRPSGLLDSMHPAGSTQAAATEELRSLLERGIKMMDRSASSRIACNAKAPEIWIPPLTHDTDVMLPMDRYLVPQSHRERISKTYQRAAAIAERDENTNNPRLLFLKQEFCSLGILTYDLNALCERLEKSAGKDRIQDIIAKGRGSANPNLASTR